jgi:Family of unknown function (DUF5715)
VKKRTRHRVAVVALVIAVALVSASLLIFLLRARRQRVEASASIPSLTITNRDSDTWAQAVEKAKEDRAGVGNVALEIPTELRHYDDRHWFLAAQVAEVKKHNIQPVQDFVDLAAMLERGEMMAVPAVTEDYVLFGVGAKADAGAFTKYADDQALAILGESQLHDEYARLEAARANILNRISDSQAARNRTRANHSESQKQLPEWQQQLKSIDAEKATLDKYYRDAANRQKLFAQYDSLKSLAKAFRGRSYDIGNSDDRQAMKIAMLSSLRPEAFKILEQIAKDYHQQFARPLPVSSLVRPEQYQHTLRRFNRNAVLIDAPPHSTGLAFDIDYRYMSGAEQNYVMKALARLKDEGRIEVIRERNANYHVFVFIDGVRPSDDLIAASLQDAGAPPDEADDAGKPPVKDALPVKKAKENSAQSKRRAKR